MERDLGIYQQDGGDLRIGSVEVTRRTISFSTGDDQYLLILHRVKPAK